MYPIRSAVGKGNEVHFNNIPGRSQRKPTLEYGVAVGSGNGVSL
jgi:hypothetical protein